MFNTNKKDKNIEQFLKNLTMRVYVQVIDTKTGVHQYGMINEPVVKGSEVANAVKHFGVIYGEVEWSKEIEYENCSILSGVVSGTTKVVSVICIL